MYFHLLTIFTSQGHICEGLVSSQIPESHFDILLEVVPLQAQLFWHFVDEVIELDKVIELEMEVGC